MALRIAVKHWRWAAAVAILTAWGAGVGAAEDQMSQADCQKLPYSILISVKNIKDEGGLITVDLHGDDPEKFLKSGAKLSRTRYPAVEGEMKICLPVEKAGVYALAIYHDLDANHKFDKTWIGLPDEPYGVSRDAPIRMAAPKHKDAAFEVAGPLTPVTVTLHR